MATTTAGGTRGNAAVTPSPRGLGWLTPVSVIIILITLLGLGLRAYFLVRPGLEAVTQYDDGPYVGSAVRLLHGVLPYRGYAFVQPPGIALLMSPAAAVSYPAGTAAGLVAGRILTVLAGAASVVLGGLLVRHRGPVAAFVTCAVLAVFAAAAAAAHTVLLEPWLVLFCLLGALAVFDGDRLAGPGGRLAWGGVAFGFAGTVKAWAIAPVLVVFLLCLLEPRPPAGVRARLRRAGMFTAGVAVGFGVPVLPFAAAGPAQFYDSVVVAQLARFGHRYPAWRRLHDLLGLPSALTWSHGALIWLLVAVLAVAVGGQAAAWLLTRRPPGTLDWFALVTAALVAAMLLWPAYFAAHYAAFFCPFLAPALGLPLARLCSRASPLAGQDLIAGAGAAPAGRYHTAGRRLAGPGAVVAGAGLLCAAIVPAIPGGGSQFQPTPPGVISKAIPAGACVVTDQSSYLLVGNRFLARSPGCSQMVDALGTDLALSGGRRPTTGATAVPAVMTAWWQAFRSARYALLTYRNFLRVPWTPRLTAYFHASFRRMLVTRNFILYVRNHHHAH